MMLNPTPRRAALGGLIGAAALTCTGVSAQTVSGAASAPNPGTRPQPIEGGPLQPRVDVHAHFLPARYRAEAAAAGHEHPDGTPGLPRWDTGLALDMMEKLNIRTAILSISSPGVHFGDNAAARNLARAVNEEGARAAIDNPGRFGLFASLPLPDVDGALAEIAYAFDTLHADGVAVESNHHGIYIGDPKFNPVMAELDRRNAVVFMHPTSPTCPCCTMLSMGYPRPMIEFMFETTRAVTNLLLTGALDRYPNIRVIVPHAGAAVPVLADRIAGLAPFMGLARPVNADQLFANLRRLYYDMAGFPLPRLAPVLMEIADPGHIFYGSDWPFTPFPVVAHCAGDLDRTAVFDDALRRRILHDNALDLFPRLRA